jgi:hypothetical protein
MLIIMISQFARVFVISLAQGDTVSALHWVEESGLSASASDLSFLREREYLTLAGPAEAYTAMLPTLCPRFVLCCSALKAVLSQH